MLRKSAFISVCQGSRFRYHQRTAAILQKFGQDGLNLAGKYGDDLAKIIDNLEPAEAKKAVNLINSYGDEAFDLFKEGKGADEVKKIVEGGCNTINGLKIIDGKVYGKIPLAEYENEKYRVDSVHNADSNIMTLGKYEPTIRADGTKDYSVPGTGSYTVKAGNTTYFSLGTEWDKITDTYGLDATGQNMFDYFNKPALDDAINAGKEIRFSHNPEAYGECALKWEWDYLQEKHGYFALEKKEIFGMQQNNFNDIRIDTGKKIKKIFGNKIRGIEYYDVVEEAGHWSFKIGFFAYDYFYVVFTYELDIIGFSIEVGNGRLISVMNTHNCYSNTDMEAYIQRIVEELELRIPDKYLQTRGWL